MELTEATFSDEVYCVGCGLDLHPEDPDYWEFLGQPGSDFENLVLCLDCYLAG